MRRIACVVLVAGLLAGCGESKLDGSSPEAYKASAAKMAEGLSKEQREKLEADLMVIAFKNFDMSQVFSGKKSAEDVTSEALKAVDGKTASQISQEADKVRAETAERDRKKAILEIADLSEKKARSEAGWGEAQKFRVMSPKFYKEKVGYLGDQFYIEMSVENGTSKAVSAARFKGVISSPGRSVPWIEKEFSHSIPGGIEPGESQAWKLFQGGYDGWTYVKYPDDAVLTVQVIGLDGADKKPIFSGGDFTERDKERLAALRAKYPN